MKATYKQILASALLFTTLPTFGMSRLFFSERHTQDVERGIGLLEQINASLNRPELLGAVQAIPHTLTGFTTAVNTTQRQFNPPAMVYAGKRIALVGLGFVGSGYGITAIYKNLCTILEQYNYNLTLRENLKDVDKKDIAKLIAGLAFLTGGLFTIAVA